MDNQKPQNGVKVSVIIPVYNTEKYLRECLDSVVNQTLGEIEIICINDGSTDGSLAILQDYGRKDNRIIVLSQENKGAGAARNAGLDIAKGEYLAILDSDDIYHTKMLEKMYCRSEKLQTDITVCFIKTYDNKTKKTMDFPWTARKIKREVFSYKDSLNSDQYFDFFVGWTWDKLFKKSFIDIYRFRFQEISHSNDAFFVFMAMYSAERITILREFLVKHRINREGSIASTHDNNPLCFFEMQKAVKDGLIKLGIFPERKERFSLWVLRHSLWVLNGVKSAESFIKIYTVLQTKIIPENNIADLPSECFDKLQNIQLKNIITLSVSEYLFDQRNIARIECAELKSELDAVHKLASYRLGRMLTWLPRKVKGFL